MSRLLFAAARGARIQFYGQYGDSHSWAEITRIPLFEVRQGYYRIHPEDEALQYGPISTALREAAAAGNAWVLTSGNGRAAAAIAETHKWDWHTFPEEHRSLFLLLVAEALADEGL